MPLSFFAGNKSNTGGAAYVSFNSKEEAVFIKIVKQTEWNTTTNHAVFKGGQTINFKLTLDEVGGLIETIRNRGKIAFFHSFDKNTTTGNFNYFEIPSKEPNRDPRRGFGLSLKNNGVDYKVAFTLGSAENLMEYLKFALTHCYSAIYAIDIKDAKEYLAKKKTAESPATPATPVTSESKPSATTKSPPPPAAEKESTPESEFDF